MPCPLCSPRKFQGVVTVVPWAASANATRFGLGTADENGTICCSFYEGCYDSLKEAKEAAENTSLEEVLAEQGYDEYDDNDDHGPADSDPYDVDYPSW